MRQPPPPPLPRRVAALAAALLAATALGAAGTAFVVHDAPLAGAALAGRAAATARAQPHLVLPRRAASAANAWSSPAAVAAAAADLDRLLAGGGSAANGTTSEAAAGRVVNAQAPPAPPPPSPATPPPAWFDWRAYLAYHTDLAPAGVTDAASAAAHYAASGRADGRLARRVGLALRYTACGGLINQHYSHVAALVLARALGADRVVLPPAAQRDSFGKYFSTVADRNEVAWTAAPLDGVLDVGAVVAAWAGRGVTVTPPTGLAPFPDLTQPGSAFPTAPPPPGLNLTLHARVPGVYLNAAPLAALADRVRAAVVEAAAPLLRADPDARLPPAVVDLPCTFFAIRTADVLPLVADVARTLPFAPSIVALADRVVAGAAAAARAPPPGPLASPSSPLPLAPFNAVHLRLESDARDWTAIMGGPAAVWDGYVRAARAAGFNATTPLYAASGLLTYGATNQLAAVVAELRRLGLASAVYHKELFLSERDLAPLTSEQKAAVDFLVLARARAFVGLGSSTFSHYVREWRALAGVARSSARLVDASAIGTDPLFAAAGTVV